MHMPSVPAVHADSGKIRAHLQAHHHDVNGIALALSLAAIAFGLVWLAWILWITLLLGVGGLSVSLFTEMTSAPDAPGGDLANAIAGSLLLAGMATLVDTPLGILAGIYPAEYGKTSMLANATRFINGILLSVPSIVVSLFVHAAVVARVQHFSGTTGMIALALLQTPVAVRTTENILNLVPNAVRKAAMTLGTPRWKMILSITPKASCADVITGVLLVMAHTAGGTAPLLSTALNNQFWSLDLDQPMATLPTAIFKFAMSPFPEWQQLAQTGVFLITLSVLGLSVLARALPTKK